MEPKNINIDMKLKPESDQNTKINDYEKNI